jgi:hypothetical protein
MSEKQKEEFDQTGFLGSINAPEYDTEIGFYEGLKTLRASLATGIAGHDYTDSTGAIDLYKIADVYKQYLEESAKSSNPTARNTAMGKLGDVNNIYKGLNIVLKATKITAGSTEVASKLTAEAKTAAAKKAEAEASQQIEVAKKMAKNVAEIEAFEKTLKAK